MVRKWRRFRALPKRAPETGASCGDQHGPQRRAWDAKAAAPATKKPVCKHRSLSTPPLPGACAAHHCQGPVIQGQLSQENSWCTSGCCNVTPASATAGSPRIRTPPFPWPEWARDPESAAPLTPSCLGGNRRPQATYTQRQGQIQSWTPGAVRTKKRKGNLSQQPQEQQIKSSQWTWCTLHLWNTWIDNGSSQIEKVDFGSNDIHIFFLFLFLCVCMYMLLCVILSVQFCFYHLS